MRIVRADGEMVTGSKGQPRLHPAIAELRGQRYVLERLLRGLKLPPEAESAPEGIVSIVSAQAVKASRARWRRTGRG